MSKLTRWVPALALLLLLAIVDTGCTAKMKAVYHQQRADRYYDAGQFDQAEIEYKNVLRNDQQNARAWSRLGLIYFDEGRAGDAAPILNRASQLDTNNLQLRLDLGTLYLGVGKIKEAREMASFVLGKDPRNDQAPILLAGGAISTNDINEIRLRLQKMASTGDTAPLEVALGTLSFRQRDLKTAETCFQTAAKLDPKFSDAYSALGNVYLAQKDVKKAEQAFKTAMELPPLRPEKTFLYANFKILTGDPDMGKSLLQALVKKTPYYLPAWIALAELAAAEKDYAGGVTLLGNVLSRDSHNPEAMLLKGRLELEQGELAKAIKDFESMTRNFPQRPVAYYELAKAQTVGNVFDKATANLNQALKLNPNYADATLLLAEIQVRHDGNYEPAIASLQQLIRQQPQSISAYDLLAMVYRSQGRLDNAVQIYRELEKAFPTNSQIRLVIGVTLLEQKKNAEARAEFDQALKLSPDFLPAVEQEVNLDLLEKQYDSAQQRVQQQIGQNPKAVPLQLLLAQVQIKRGDTNQAESTLKQTIAMAPDSQQAYFMLAELYAAAHENQKALADLSAALAKNPKDVGALLLMGMTYNAEKDYDHARDAYEKLLAVATNNVMALNNLAFLYSQNLGQLDKGYQLARRARDLAPADPSTADTLGWILYQQGQYSSALSLLQESAGKMDSAPQVQFHLGMTYYVMGDEANARTALQRALQISQDFAEKDECNQCLTVLDIDPKTAGADTRVVLEKRVASQPKDSVAQLRLAAIYQREGTPDKAIAAYEAALQASPQNVAALVNLAGLYAPQDPQKALNLAKTAYKLAPNDPLVSHTLGRLAFLTGDYAWSLNLLQLTARNQPQDPEVLYDLGGAFYSVGRVSDAISSMQNALHNGAAFSHADATRRFLAMTDLLDKPAQALAAQSQVADILKSTPDYVPALMVEAATAEQKPDLATAQQTYEAVLNHYPDFAPAQKQLVLLYVKDAKNDAKANSLAVKARQSFPTDPEIAKALGVIVYRQGDFARAASLLTESASQLNRDAELMYYLGMAQYQLKHSAQCKTALKQALDLNLSGPQAVDAKRILAELK
jgi:tetratricopeptide (TPR) repeat protein